MTTLSAALKQLHSMMLAEDYDLDHLRPTSAAFDSAWNLISAAYAGTVPPRHVSVGAIGDGGLAVRWLRRDRDVSLTVPPEGLAQAHIYFADAGGDGIIMPVTSEQLAARLQWLAQG